MTEQSQFRRPQADIVVTLTAVGTAGAIMKIPRSGRAYHVISVTTDGKVLIGLNQDPTQFLYKGVGEQVAFDEPGFTEINLSNTDAAPQTIIIKTSFGEIKDSRFNPVGGTIPIAGAVTVTNTVAISEVFPSVIAPQAASNIAAGAHLDVGSNAARKLITVYNPSTTDTLYLRDQSGTTSIGEPIGPSQSWRGTFTGAFRLRNNSANPINGVLVTEYT